MVVKQGSKSRTDQGFTLVELLIVVTILPLIVGALAAGLIAVFSLQSGVQNRLADTADAQVVSANYENDVQSATYITTYSGAPGSQCGTGTQLLGLEWNPDPNQPGKFDTVVSYVEVQNGTAYSLVRNYCSSGFSPGASSSTTLSYDLPASQAAPSILPSSVANLASSNWTPASAVTTVTFPIIEPKSTYPYTLVAVPQASSTAAATGSPITTSSTAGCGFASPGSGAYASTLCFVDFSSLTGNNMLEATSDIGCGLQMSVNLPGNFHMYFCIAISGAPVSPTTLPTYPQAFLGNSGAGNTANYTNVPGEPGLYQTCEGGSSTCIVNGNSVPNTWGGTTTVTISNIVVDNPEGIPATGWEAVGGDAESTDSGESMTWSSNVPLCILNSGHACVPASDPVGNACLADQTVSGLTGAGTTQLECSGTMGSEQETSSSKTGAALVWGLTPTTFTTTLHGTGLEAMVFGLLVS
jgi:prepilin-type N-terminal cleavage/methylation domain-containing protein